MDDDSSAAPDWRPLIAALGNRDARAVYARLVLGDGGALADLAPSRARHVREVLVGAGLVTVDGDALAVDEMAFRRLLVAPRNDARGIERFLRPDGRIDRYPRAAAERRALLEHIAARAIREDEELNEREITDRLAAYADDVALLRRHLVDYGLIDRTPSGSAYTLPARAVSG